MRTPMLIKAALAAAALACCAAPVAAANHVDSLGQEWLPLTAAAPGSWAAIDAVCSSRLEAPGACNGSLGGVDVTGWTWASRDQVLALIGEFMAAAGDSTPPSTITGPHGYGSQSHGWAAAIIAAMGVTVPIYGNYTAGYTNGNPGEDAWLCNGGLCGWQSYAAACCGNTFGSQYYGAWLYRAAPVPEPASVALLLAGAGLLAARARRKTGS